MEDWNKNFERWMKASYAYYVTGNDIMSDAEWDDLGRKLEKNWDAVEHPDKNLIKVDDDPHFLHTGFYLQFKYPEWAKQ